MSPYFCLLAQALIMLSYYSKNGDFLIWKIRLVTALHTLANG